MKSLTINNGIVGHSSSDPAQMQASRSELTSQGPANLYYAGSQLGYHQASGITNNPAGYGVMINSYGQLGTLDQG